MQIKHTLTTTAIALSAVLTCTSCIKGGKGNTALQTFVESENAKCPYQTGEYTLTGLDLTKTAIVFTYATSPDQMKNLNPGKSREQLVKNAAQNESMLNLINVLLKEGKNLRYVFLDSITHSSVSLDFEQDALREIAEGE